MPNHVHGIIIISDAGGRGTAESLGISEKYSTRRAPTERFGKPVAGSIPTIIRSYKSAVALRINLMRRTIGSPVWQRNYYEHIIRDIEEFLAISNYIFHHPQNWDKDDENPKR
jgi:putative transposase